MTITLENGKYTVIENDGVMTGLRYGEPWARDLCGDKLVYAFCCRVEELEGQRDELLEALETLVLAQDMKEALGKEAPVYRALRESGWKQTREAIAKAKGGAS